jgi:hypothetical protein
MKEEKEKAAMRLIVSCMTVHLELSFIVREIFCAFFHPFVASSPPKKKHHLAVASRRRQVVS